MTFADNNDGTGTLSGTPTADGVYSISFTAQNAIDPTDTQTFTLTVNESAAITSVNNATFVVDTPQSFTVTTAGYPPPSLGEMGTLPAGVTFVGNQDGTGTLSGTPTASGIYSISFTAKNGTGSPVTQSFTLTVNQVPAITSTNNTTFAVGTGGSFTVTTTGYPTPRLTETGTLPGDVTFVDNRDGTGTLSGMPTAGGVYSITFTAQNGVSPNASQTFTLTVNQAASITSVNSTTFMESTGSSFTVTTTGYPLPSLSESGTMPSGVMFVDNHNGTGTLSGTPTTNGVYNINFTASNTSGSPSMQAFTLTVNQAPAITSSNNTTYLVGTSGSFTVTTTGYPIPSVSETGALPAGVMLVDNHNGTATLSGSPTTNGIFSITFTAQNGVSPNATQTFTLTVNQVAAITSANNTSFTSGAPASFTVTTTGYPTPSLSELGTMPTGVMFVDNHNGTGTLSGTTNASGVYNISFTASNSAGSPATQTFTLTVNQAPAITSAVNATFTTGASNSFTVTATGYPLPALSEAGAPGGITFTDNHNGTATLGGSPSAGGVYSISFTGSNGIGSNAVQSFALTVNQAPAITSANNTSFTSGAPATFTVITTGYPTPSLSESGTMPAGVTFMDNHNGTATLGGTPTADGVYNIIFTASNSAGSPSQTFTLTVNQAPAITSATSTTFTTGASNSFTVTTTGYPASSLSESGAMPNGVMFTDNHNGTGTLSGNPTASGVYNISFAAANGIGSNAVQSFTLTVNQAPAITSTNSTTFTVNASGSFTVTTTGYPTPSLSETGALPSGVTFVDNHNGTGTLSGTPTANGVFSLSLSASNGIGSNAMQAFTLTVNQAPAITSASNTTFTVGTAGLFTVSTTGYPAPSLGETGALPSGVTFTDNHNGTGTLSGTPTANGVFSLSLTASNGIGSPATQAFTLTVTQVPAITSANNTTFTAGTAGSFTVSATGYPTPSLSETGALPSGVTFVDNHNGTGTLSGTPAAGGVFSISFSAQNGIGSPATQAFTLTVSQAPAITSANNVTFVVKTAGSFTVTTTGYPISSITEKGTLPKGLKFVDNKNGTGTLSGTPTATGPTSITFTASNGIGSAATQTFTVTVGLAPAIGSANNTSFVEGTAGSFTVSTSGYPTPSITEAGAMPMGVTFVDNHTGNGKLSGTASSTGVYNITFTAQNGVGSPATQNFTLTVGQTPAITSAKSTTFPVSKADSFTVTTTGYPVPTITEKGTLPKGVTFVANPNGTATLSGTPTVKGTYSLTFTATNGVGSAATQAFTVTVQ